jgi:hypothetical protein
MTLRTKSELRAARIAAKANGEKLIGELALPHNSTASKRTLNRKAGRLRAKLRAGN